MVVTSGNDYESDIDSCRDHEHDGVLNEELGQTAAHVLGRELFDCRDVILNGDLTQIRQVRVRHSAMVHLAARDRHRLFCVVPDKESFVNRDESHLVDLGQLVDNTQLRFPIVLGASNKIKDVSGHLDRL